LIANELVSVQPMSLPSGLIFFLDFTKQAPANGMGDYATSDTRDGLVVGGAKPSIYGGNVVGSEVTGGVNLGTADPAGFTGLRQGFSAARGAAGAISGSSISVVNVYKLSGSVDATAAKALRYDPDLIATTDGSYAVVLRMNQSSLASAPASGHPLYSSSPANAWNRARKDGATHLNLTTDTGTAISTEGNFVAAGNVVRRLTRMYTDSGTKKVEMVWHTSNAGALSSSGDAGNTALGGTHFAVEFAMDDNISTKTDGGGALVGATAFEMENSKAIPEINIKVDSVPVTSTTRKLKAHWTPELAQDLNAYHNLDAEVELTGILSEEIALEIDQEIQNDLIRGATAATYYWSRLPGKFVKKTSGSEQLDANGAYTGPPDFTGTVSEWYETLIETINDVSAEIHKKTLRGGANFLVTSPEVANILEFTSGFRAKVTHDDDKGQAGAVNVGSMNNKFEVYVNPYFPRNLILVGRKGSSFLESGYVYAPYVPLQTTPTIFDPDNFTPRKAVMTRYGKKMVRPDMYGLVVVQDLSN
jgi:hypothetical protein